MWKRLSLRSRLFLPLCLMFLAALLFGAVSLQNFTPLQLIDENEPAARSAKVVADALNGALQASTNPQQTLDAFARSLGTSEAIRFRRADSGPLVRQPTEARTQSGGIPHWFVKLLSVPDIGTSFPVVIGRDRVGDIVFAPDISADIFEKWVGFLAILSATAALILLTGIIAYFTAGATLEPLRHLGEGLTRMRMGDYDHPIPASGPPEIRKSSEEANELARTLGRLSHDNRSLLREILSLQDDERRDIARDLHDELSPLLFGIRASTIALLDAIPEEKGDLGSSAQGILQSVEALQQANRRILDRLRPLHIQELGLERSIQTLLHNARAQMPGIKLTASIDPLVNGLDGPLSQTVYRVIQEGVTNVLRHANAQSTDVRAAISDWQIEVQISDDGVGFPTGNAFGRGLTGMQERVRALSGTFELLREDGRTIVRCRLPAGTTTADGRTGRQA